MLLTGDAKEKLKEIESGTVQCCMTSPPYWGLRAYGTSPQIWADSLPLCAEHDWLKAAPRRERHEKDVKNKESKQATNTGANIDLHETNFCAKCGAWRGELGLEPTPELYVKHLVEIFREVKRVLRNDGTLWLNLGGSYWGGKGQSAQAWSTEHLERETLQKKQHQIMGMGETRPQDGKHDIFKPKDLCGIPWRVAFALQADGWWLRSDIIWSKPNPMPESVTDRPTKSHEYIFLLTKSASYYYDQEAVREKEGEITRRAASFRNGGVYTNNRSFNNHGGTEKDTHGDGDTSMGRNLRSVWTIPTKPYSGAHFATFPERIPELCIKAGSKPGDIILDPFAGSGTTLEVAKRLGRDFIGIELNPKYMTELIEPRLAEVNPLFQQGGVK